MPTAALIVSGVLALVAFALTLIHIDEDRSRAAAAERARDLDRQRRSTMERTTAGDLDTGDRVIVWAHDEPDGLAWFDDTGDLWKAGDVVTIADAGAGNVTIGFADGRHVHATRLACAHRVQTPGRA